MTNNKKHQKEEKPNTYDSIIKHLSKEIAEVQRMLDEAKYKIKTYEDNLEECKRLKEYYELLGEEYKEVEE